MNSVHHIVAEVLENRPTKEVCQPHHILTIRAPKIASHARPGQFVHCAPGYSLPAAPLLRRPISISGVVASGSSDTPDSLELMLRLVGSGTRILARRKAGESIDCLGPLGNGFSLAADRTCLLIAGGMGIAPLRWLAKDLSSKGAKVYLLAGAKSADDFPCEVVQGKEKFVIPEFEGLGIETEFVSEEQGLLVTDLVSRRLPELLSIRRPVQAYAVGPGAMLKALADLLPVEVACEVSLEERMACGVGACRSCVAALRHPDTPGHVYRRVCKEGPVFDLRDIVWARDRVE